MRDREILKNLKLAGIPAPEQLADYWSDDEEHQSVDQLEFFLACHAAREWLFEHEIPELPPVLDNQGIQRTNPEDIRMHQAIEALIVERDLRVGKWRTKAEIAALILEGKELAI